MFHNFFNFNKKQEESVNTEEENSIPGSNLGRSITYSLLALALIIAFAYVLRTVLVPVLFSIILASLMFPVCIRLERLGFSRAMAALSSLVLMIILFAGMVYLLVFQSINIGQDASEIVGKIETVLKDAESWADEKLNLSRTELITNGKQQLEKVMPGVGAAVTAFFGSIGNLLSMGILVPLIIFFLLYYREFFKAFFVKAIGKEHQQKVETTITKIYEAIKNYMGGLLTVMGIVAILNSVGLMIIGIEHAWFFGIMASLLMLLPYIGIAIGSILPALFAIATKDSYWYALAVIGWFQVVQILEGNFITPNIVGGKVSLNPLVSILSIFLFSMLFGFAGLILALPLMAILKVIFDTVPQLQPYGFLFGEPAERFLKTDQQKLKAAKKKALGEKQPD